MDTTVPIGCTERPSGAPVLVWARAPARPKAVRRGGAATGPKQLFAIAIDMGRGAGTAAWTKGVGAADALLPPAAVGKPRR
jgi:hypothetical protein